ncbi:MULTISPECIES: two-partner secretion domain-containing protein [Caballeronia]|uniref:two-partner secretion domain-containing protein n=1 Tax=Caballeronia TaxID=1827195 RepID=UPI002028085C|nr:MULTISPECIES: filamentous hemagglutinin N-terminal domain-containing protein [Caballeronia]
MNKNRFRRVFSKRHGMLVAVAEDVTSQGKAPGEGNASSSSPQSAKMGVIATMTAFALAMFASTPATSFAQALPTGGQVTAGQASISQNSNTMTINQGTQRAVIDWNSFNVGQGNTVQFNQPNAQAQALNRVTGAGASNIQGSLLANGQVLIQNANGVLFGKGAVVNVGSLLATTKSIDANQFMSGGPLKLSGTGKNASVVNDGTINAQGYVTLMGDQVRNTGSIDAGKNGQVALAAGDSATVALANGQGIQLTLNNATANALVENSGTIKADNGSVLLTARGSNTLLNSVVNMSGVVKAGTVVADAGNTGDVTVSGKIDASNMSAGGQGGTVVLSGNRVGVFGNASIDASGDKSGGKVIIGGDSLSKLSGTQAQGMLQDGVQFADFTQVDSGATIKADAAHGDGGFIETSGHSLSVQGNLSAAAPNGKGGEWLIDPTDVTISTGADANYTGGMSGFTPSGNAATVNNQSISNVLSGGTNVTITTASSGTATGNIVQQAGADIVKTSGTDATLTMLANGSIHLNGNITSTANKLNLNLTADMSGNHNGSVTVQGANTNLNGGTLSASGNTVNGSGLAGANAVYLAGNITNVGGGSIKGTANTGVGVTIAPGARLTQSGAGIWNITGVSNSGIGVSAGAPGKSTKSAISVAGNATLNINGTSESGTGVFVIADVAANQGATINISGTSNSGVGLGIDSTAATTGYSFGSTLTSDDEATININARSNTQVGMSDWDGAFVARGNSTINLDAASNTTWGAQGYWSSTATDNAHINLNGSGTTGLWYQGSVNASGNGVVNLTGIRTRFRLI